MMGQLASIGHRSGVAMVFGIKFSGLYRVVFLAKRLPDEAYHVWLRSYALW